jgi:hypothetical protein
MMGMKRYRELEPLAYELYYELYGKPKTHYEWANGFNIRGKMIRILNKKEDG